MSNNISKKLEGKGRDAYINNIRSQIKQYIVSTELLETHRIAPNNETFFRLLHSLPTERSFDIFMQYVSADKELKNEIVKGVEGITVQLIDEISAELKQFMVLIHQKFIELEPDDNIIVTQNTFIEKIYNKGKNTTREKYSFDITFKDVIPEQDKEASIHFTVPMHISKETMGRLNTIILKIGTTDKEADFYGLYKDDEDIEDISETINQLRSGSLNPEGSVIKIRKSKETSSTVN